MQGCRRILGAIGALALALVGASPAWAGNATVAESLLGTTVTITTSAIDDEFRLSIDGANALLVDSTSVTDFDAGAGCADVGLTDVSCAGGAALTRVVISTGDGDDDVRADTDLAAVIDATLGAGEDDLLVSDNLQRVEADGGEGPDSFFTGPGADRLDGGPGADGFNAGLGSDDLLGGPGIDLVAYCCVQTGDLVINLDNLRNDGDPLVESDLIMDVESLSGSTGDDIITGDDGLNDLHGGAGSDRIDGRGGFDRFFADEGNDTLLTRDGLAESVDCADGVDVATMDEIDIASECETLDAAADLQPDRDADGLVAPLDCNDLDGTTRPGAFDRPGDGIDQNCDGADAVDLDRDRDGFLIPLDCDDGNRAIRPGAPEAPGNAVDEDCDGAADPFPAFPTVVLLSTRVRGPITELVGLVLVDLDGGERVRVACRGRGCRFKARRRRAKARADSLILDRVVRGGRLRPGARLAVAMTRSDGVRKTVRFTMRRGKAPRSRSACSGPGGGKVARC